MSLGVLNIKISCEIHELNIKGTQIIFITLKKNVWVMTDLVNTSSIFKPNITIHLRYITTLYYTFQKQEADSCKWIMPYYEINIFIKSQINLQLLVLTFSDSMQMI